MLRDMLLTIYMCFFDRIFSMHPDTTAIFCVLNCMEILNAMGIEKKKEHRLTKVVYNDYLWSFSVYLNDALHFP